MTCKCVCKYDYDYSKDCKHIGHVESTTDFPMVLKVDARTEDDNCLCLSEEEMLC